MEESRLAEDIADQRLGMDPQPTGLSDRRKAAILVTCCMSALITGAL